MLQIPATRLKLLGDCKIGCPSVPVDVNTHCEPSSAWIECVVHRCHKVSLQQWHRGLVHCFL